MCCCCAALLFTCREGLKTIQQVVEMACQGNVEGYLQLTDHIIQQIKCTDQPHLKDVGTTLTQEAIIEAVFQSLSW